jgi:integrase
VRWEQLDLAGGKWTIPGDESKNREAMDVVLSAEALAVLQRRLDARDPDNPSAYVFPSRNENARVPHLCEPKAAWRRICKDARLFDLRIHDLRRSFGSWQAGAGASLLTIGKSLGHLDSDTTKVYARLDLAPVRESVDRATVALRAAIEAAKEKAKKEATA